MLLLIFFFQVSFRTYTAAFLRDRQVYHRKMRFLQLGLSLSLLFFFSRHPLLKRYEFHVNMVLSACALADEK